MTPTTFNNSNLPAAVTNMFPSLNGTQVMYNAEHDIFHTMGYTSNAGNTYYEAFRISPRLAVFYNIGEGYAYTFLNGITIFAFDGRKPKIIARREWGGCNWRTFDEASARETSINMLKEYIHSEMRLRGYSLSDSNIDSAAKMLINETHHKLIG